MTTHAHTPTPHPRPLPRPRRIARYGWTRDLPDARDHRYAAPAPVLAALPASVDLRAQMPAVYNQGQLGSCTGNAIAAAIQAERMRQQLPAANTATPSRLFIYYNERSIEGTVTQDSGGQIRDGIKSVATQGACFETGPAKWPYVISNFAKRPPARCYTEAATDTTVEYSALEQSLLQMKGCLASGYPFVFGFTVYESFESPQVAKTGAVPMPAANESVLGGHAVLAVGYDDATQQILVRNSWGTAWGLGGYFLLPYAYIANPNLASDFWTIRMVHAAHEVATTDRS